MITLIWTLVKQVLVGFNFGSFLYVRCMLKLFVRGECYPLNYWGGSLSAQGPTGCPAVKRILVICPSSLVQNWSNEVSFSYAGFRDSVHLFSGEI